jgi:hydroxymethylpyrimidine pyrophosphatase-like HAD family hydrolase
MGPEEWVEGSAGLVKVDYEQHNFGGAELDAVDPALDLAGAIFEFSLSAREERELLRAYASASGDARVSERLLLYHLVYGVLTMSRASGMLARDESPEQHLDAHQRRLAARDALVYRMSRFCGGFLSRRGAARWSDRLFFLDVDGVFDRPLLGFPHTTPSGLAALELLDAHGVSVVLNTGRGVDHVRDYCRSYGLAGGLAEFGSVFLDAVNRREVSLLSPRGAAQLVLFRDAVKRLPGTFVDRGYRYSVRVFRYDRGSTTCLPASEVEALLERCGGDALTIHASTECTHVSAAGTGKGEGARALARILKAPCEPEAAIGDSDADREMLLATRFAYVPANGSSGMRELTRSGRARRMRHAYQRGLLDAVQDLLVDRSMDGDRIASRTHRDGAAGDLVLDLLRAADRSRTSQTLAALAACAGWTGRGL